MSVLIVANVVTGAVVASYRRIGVLKSIGFSPAQVVCGLRGQGGRAGRRRMRDRRRGRQPAGHPGAASVRSFLRRRQPVGAGLGRHRHPARDVRPGRADGARARVAGRAAVCGAGHRARARAATRPRLHHAPACQPAAAAEAGQHRAGGAVRPPGPHRRNAGRHHVRRHCGRLRCRPEHHACQGRGGSEPGRHRAGSGFARYGQHLAARQQARPGHHCGTAEPAGHAAVRRDGTDRAQRGRAGPAGEHRGVRRQCGLARLRPDQRPLVHRPRAGGRQHRLPQPDRADGRPEHDDQHGHPVGHGADRRPGVRAGQPARPAHESADTRRHVGEPWPRPVRRRAQAGRHAQLVRRRAESRAGERLLRVRIRTAASST